MANEIKFYLSGGSSNTNPFQSIGGSISNTEIINGLLNNLWSDVSESDASNGVTDHRVIYVKNVSGAPLTDMRAYFGELDNFVGLAVLTSTTSNSSVAQMASAIDAVTDYYQFWQNIAETGTVATKISLNQTNKRVCLYIQNTKHHAYNQFPDKIDILMAKTGAPTGTATVKIWAMASGVVAPSASDNTVIRTLGTLDVSGLSTTFTTKTFSTPADVVTDPLPSVGWRIGIEYTGGTSAATVDIAQTSQPNQVGVIPPANYDGGYSQSWDGSKWLDFAANSPAFNLYTNTGACFQAGNPPPVGGGTPPPDTCGATNAPAGTVPVAGGGGGAAQHGYNLTSATDNGNDGNQATGAIDRNLATRWSQNSTNALLTVDMGQAHPVDRLKIAWYKGDERQAKFNIAYSTDNTTFTPITPGGGSSFKSSGSSLQLEQFSLVQQAGSTSSTVGDVTSVSVTLEVPWLAMQTGDNPGGTSAAFIVRDLGDELLECITNPITNGSGADKGWMDKNGYEICDLCENHSNATTATFSDGLQVPYYWDTQTSKCVAPGAASGGVAISENPTYSDHGGPVLGSAVIYLIFWGPTWSTSQTAFKNTVTDLVQNKLLGSDASTFFSTARSDYNFNTPTWGGSATNTNSPANTSSYTSADVMVAIQQAISANSVPNPANSSFTTTGGQRCSNYVYAVIPDLSWHAFVNDSDNSIAEAIHLSMTYTTTTNPDNPPSNPPPPTIPPPTPVSGAFSARYIRYIGLGNTQNNWNSVTELEVYGSQTSDQPPPSPPPPNGGNNSKPSSYDTGVPIPNLNNGDFVAIHLERAIPQGTAHSDIDNYSIVISNEPHPAPPTDEPIPPGGGGGVGGGGGGGDVPIGEIPLPTPPGVFDPGTIPPPTEVPSPPPPGQCPGPPDQPPPPPDGGGGGGGGGGTGQTPDGIQLVELPAGRTYGDQHTNFHENFQSNGSFRLDCGVQPQLDELNLTFYLNLSSGSDEISSKLSGGTHTDSKAKNGRCYDIGLNQDGKRVRIRKEDPHPSYHDGPSHSISLGSLNGKWVGVQSLKWNEGSNCHLQCWVDTSGSESPTNKWSRILDDIDTGGWFESPYLHCYDSSDSQTTIRVDGMSTSKFHYKFLCATRIK